MAGTNKNPMEEKAEKDNLNKYVANNRKMAISALAGVGLLSVLGLINYCSNDSNDRESVKNEEQVVADSASNQNHHISKDSVNLYGALSDPLFDSSELYSTNKDTLILKGKGNPPSGDTLVLENDAFGNVVDTIHDSRKTGNGLEKKTSESEKSKPQTTNNNNSNDKEQSQYKQSRRSSQGGLSRKSDPAKDYIENAKESFWAFQGIKYDCSGEFYSFPRGIEWSAEGGSMELNKVYTTENPSNHKKMNSNYRRINPSEVFGDAKNYEGKEFEVDSVVSKELNQGVHYKFGKFRPAE